VTAAQMLGAVPVPVYADAVAEEMAYVLDNADVVVAVVQDQEQVDKMLGRSRAADQPQACAVRRRAARPARTTIRPICTPSPR
jgi:long-subunit acyl-CoA synthetase (AMP-forming)